MVYRISELEPETEGPLTFVRVHFWRSRADMDAGRPAERVNDHRMQLVATGVRAIQDAQGRFLTEAGAWITPEEARALVEAWARSTEGDGAVARMPGTAPFPIRREMFDRDLPAEMDRNIRAYWQEAEAARRAGKPYPRDHRDDRVRRDPRKATDVTARADVRALRGAAVEAV